MGLLVLEPILKERIWGVEQLPSPYPQPEAGKPIGEVWLTALECAVKGLPGQTLGSLFPDFPLLLKMIFPREKLSVQVHPNDEQARQRGELRGKTECWYVLDAAPDAAVALGLKPGVKLEDLGSYIADGSMEEKLQMVPVKAGDMVFVDAGTIHAIGPHMTVLETQEYSDVTYRLYDYGRPRELHLEQGLAVSRLQTRSGLVTPQPHEHFTRLSECEYFAVDEFKLQSAQELPLAFSGQLQIFIAFEEGAWLRPLAGGEPFPLPKAQAVVLPEAEAEYVLSAGYEVRVMRILKP